MTDMMDREALERELLQQQVRQAKNGADKEEAQAVKFRLEADALQRAKEWDEALPGYHMEYVLYGVVDGSTIKNAMGDLGKWSRRAPEGTPLKVLINSPGGSVIDGLALYGFLRNLSRNGHPVTTVAIGQASSMGGILLQAGDTRIMDAEAWLLIHEVSAGAIGNVSEMKDRTKFMERLLDQAIDILSARSTMTKRQIKNKMTRTDWWLRADEALELGFCDEVQ